MAAKTCKVRLKEAFGTCSQLDVNKRMSVVIGIPAYNERKRIRALLNQIMNQKEVQIDKIILNISGSTDGTDEEVAAATRFFPQSPSIQIIDKHVRAGKAAAVDEILSACNSDILILTDGDVRLNDRCLEQILKPFFLDTSVGVVSGNVMSLNDGGNNLFSFVSQLERQLHHELCMDLVGKSQAPKVNGTFFALRTKMITCLPHQTVSDDEYVSCCTQKKGYRVAYAPNAVVYTKDPENCRDYVAKRRRILVGHFLIRKELGYRVPTAQLSEIVPRMLKHLAKEKKQVLPVSAMFLLQCISYVLAVFDTITGTVPYFYRVESAKF
jgi:cellulose synthase/poly-beta-1,6-N-acetylglucosamine synthase-like glycosyltransferase